ncbi:hypothetical protein O9H85_01145 [Paenibacillus filicis]|uniref:Uncharacterized protein n=1 Tax=Paenibacillus gyeongsangnamensis TaxID=3388067 RepID=A0ABT4Q2F3_9BACL|nr:hypothetical protein [Paenibacillus filicis]MCZ8511062.1 hypothetical protein [Paenibacillus filicis]
MDVLNPFVGVLFGSPERRIDVAGIDGGDHGSALRGLRLEPIPPRYAEPLPPPMHELMRMEAIAAIITDMPFVILGRPLFLPG